MYYKVGLKNTYAEMCREGGQRLATLSRLGAPEVSIRATTQGSRNRGWQQKDKPTLQRNEE
jgi:hypothetical protein